MKLFVFKFQFYSHNFFFTNLTKKMRNRSYRGPSLAAVRKAASQGARRAMQGGRRASNMLTRKTMGLPNWALLAGGVLAYKNWDKIKGMFSK